MSIGIHIDFPPIKTCKNIKETYGELCVKCNKCHRFNPDWTCPLCGKRTRAMKSRKTWRVVETYDDFRLPICPGCQHRFREDEFETETSYPATLPFRTVSLKLMLDWRDGKCTGVGK